jgi:HAD superfamily hydrolase (TIGR01509 family)
MTVIFDLYNVLYPYSEDAEFVVAELRARGFDVAAISSMAPSLVNEIVQKYGIEKVLSAQETPYSKRDPVLYNLFLDKFGLKADECLLVDDSLEKLSAAKKVGMKICWLNVENEKPPSNEAADYIISSFKDLLKKINQTF